MNKSNLVHYFLDCQKSDLTKLNYENDLLSLAEYFSLDSNLTKGDFLEAVSFKLLSFDFHESFNFGVDYRKYLLTYPRKGKGLRGYSASTINRRISTIRSFYSYARDTGIINYSPKFSFLKTVKYRDTAGPGKEVIEFVVSSLRKEIGLSEKGLDILVLRRDLCILLLAYVHGLRRSEIISIDFNNYDKQRGYLYFTQKRIANELSHIVLPKKLKKDIDDYIEARGLDAGPLFFRKQRVGGVYEALSPSSVNRIFFRIKDKYRLSKSFTPHGVRHTSITNVVEQARKRGGDPTLAQAHSRHADLNTLMRYDDNHRRKQFNGAQFLSDVMDGL